MDRYVYSTHLATCIPTYPYTTFPSAKGKYHINKITRSNNLKNANLSKGGPYENFAGRDASRGLAHQSFDLEMLTEDLKGPLDDLKDLDADQLENLQGWEERFLEKYLVVGKLVAEGDAEAPKS